MLSLKLFGDRFLFGPSGFRSVGSASPTDSRLPPTPEGHLILAARSGPAPTISRICARTRESPPNFSSLTLDQVIGGPNPPSPAAPWSRETT